eukprot:7267738-Prymnesium_polylepis.1
MTLSLCGVGRYGPCSSPLVGQCNFIVLAVLGRLICTEFAQARSAPCAKGERATAGNWFGVVGEKGQGGFTIAWHVGSRHVAVGRARSAGRAGSRRNSVVV